MCWPFDRPFYGPCTPYSTISTGCYPAEHPACRSAGELFPLNAPLIDSRMENHVVFLRAPFFQPKLYLTKKKTCFSNVQIVRTKIDFGNFKFKECFLSSECLVRARNHKKASVGKRSLRGEVPRWNALRMKPKCVLHLLETSKSFD